MASQVEAVARTLEALDGDGRLEPVDAARVEIVRGLAAAVDGDPENASLWREFRAAMGDLLKAGDSGGDDFAAYLAGVRATLGHAAESGASDSGS